MASSIQLLRSTNPQERPFAGNLLEGQPAANLHSSEPGLFFKTTDGSVVKFGPAAITSDGSPPNSTPQGSAGNSIGELWLDKSFNPPVLRVYDGSEWVDAGSGGGGGGGSGSFVRWIYTAVGGETSLSGTSNGVLLEYTAGLEEVYVNGVLITRGTDYSAVNGTSITNLAPLTAGDIVTVLSMNPLETVQLPGQVTLLRWTVLATAGQTVLSGIDSSSQQLAYTTGFEEVYVNGAFLRRGADYTATNGSTITILSPLAEDDKVTVMAWSVIEIGSISIGTSDIQDGAVTGSKIAADAVTDAKVAPDAAIDSEKLSYIPPLTGTVSRTVEEKLADFVSVRDFGAVGDGVTDDTAAIQAAIAAVVAKGGGTVFVPFGTYKVTETLYLAGVSGFVGESTKKASSSQFDIGGSSIFAEHTGAAVLSLKGASGVHLSNLTLEADQNTAPKAGLVLGRSTTASAGNHLIEKLNIRGNYSVACIYSVASEENQFTQVTAWLYAESTGFATYYCAESDTFSVDTLTTSTNITSYFYGCSFINSAFDDGDPLRSPSVVYIDAKGQTGGFCFTSCYLVPNAGSYITINNAGAPTNEILGPFIFNGVNGERLGDAGDPAYGLRVISSTTLILRGLTFIGSRFNFLAGATKKTLFFDSQVNLYNPAIIINPEEAFPYAVIDVPVQSIKGGIFSVAREGFWKTLTLEGSWVNRFGSPYQQAEYKIDPNGQVCLRGELSSGTGLITTLPVEARPRTTTRLKVLSDAGVCIVTISETTGNVTLASGTAAGLDLNAVRFFRN